MRIQLNCDIGYNRGSPVLRDVKVELASGKLYCVLGPNGSGKTAFLQTLSGILPPLKGRVERSDSGGSIYLPPDPPRLPSIRVGDVLLNIILGGGGILLYGEDIGVYGERADGFLKELSYNSGLDVLYDDLSTGEKMKVLLAGALASPEKIVMLDEPNNHLDLASRASLYKLLRRESVDRLVVLSLHDINEASLSCDQVLLLERSGRVYGPGSPGEVMDKTLLERIYGVRLRESLLGETRLFLPA